MLNSASFLSYNLFYTIYKLKKNKVNFITVFIHFMKFFKFTCTCSYKVMIKRGEILGIVLRQTFHSFVRLLAARKIHSCKCRKLYSIDITINGHVLQLCFCLFVSFFGFLGFLVFFCCSVVKKIQGTLDACRRQTMVTIIIFMTTLDVLHNRDLEFLSLLHL